MSICWDTITERMRKRDGGGREKGERWGEKGEREKSKKGPVKERQEDARVRNCLFHVGMEG